MPSVGFRTIEIINLDNNEHLQIPSWRMFFDFILIKDNKELRCWFDDLGQIAQGLPIRTIHSFNGLLRL